MRGTMSGLAWVDGRALARKAAFPLADNFPPLVAEGVEGAYPSSGATFCRAERTEEVTDPRVLKRSSGSSDVGKGGEDAKSDEICSSAVWESGDPMRPFCCSEIPYSARRELGASRRATSGSLSPMSVFQTSTARRLSRTYTQTAPLQKGLDNCRLRRSFTRRTLPATPCLHQRAHTYTLDLFQCQTPSASPSRSARNTAISTDVPFQLPA